MTRQDIHCLDKTGQDVNRPIAKCHDPILEEFTLPGDGMALQVVRDEDGTRWATARALASWLDYSHEQPIRRLANAHVPEVSKRSRTERFASAGAAIGGRVSRTVTVYGEDAWRLLAERGRTERARAVSALFVRWLADEGRLARAEAKGTFSYARAVLGIAKEKLEAKAVKAPEESTERAYLEDVCGQLDEHRRLAKHAAADPLALEASLASVAHALPRGEVDPDAVRSQRRKDQESRKALLALDGPVARTTTDTLRINGKPIHTTTTKGNQTT